METLTESYFNTEAWLIWAVGSIDEYMEETTMTENERKTGRKHNSTTGESPAVEVVQYRIHQGYFATSTEVRSPKSKDVLFSVGQMVKHKTSGYRGVIIGWDIVAKAPEVWFEKIYPRKKQKEWREMPTYAILVDTRDRSDSMTTYVPQELLELQKEDDIEIKHPKLGDYFVEKVGKIYIAQSWLQQLYPED